MNVTCSSQHSSFIKDELSEQDVSSCLECADDDDADSTNDLTAAAAATHTATATTTTTTTTTTKITYHETPSELLQHRGRKESQSADLTVKIQRQAEKQQNQECQEQLVSSTRFSRFAFRYENSDSSSLPPQQAQQHHHQVDKTFPAPNSESLHQQELYSKFQAWALKNYGESGKTKTVTRNKYKKVINILKGIENAITENSKLRFWVKAKGFCLGRGTTEFNDSDREVLYIPAKNSCCLELGERSLKRVAVVEDFFQIIYNVHVEMDGRGGKHAGQKRTYRAIAETYAFLPREAVTKFLMSCADCQKRMHFSIDNLEERKLLNQSGPLKISKFKPHLGSSADCPPAVARPRKGLKRARNNSTGETAGPEECKRTCDPSATAPGSMSNYAPTNSSFLYYFNSSNNNIINNSKNNTSNNNNITSVGGNSNIKKLKVEPLKLTPNYSASINDVWLSTATIDGNELPFSNSSPGCNPEQLERQQSRPSPVCYEEMRYESGVDLPLDLSLSGQIEVSDERENLPVASLPEDQGRLECYNRNFPGKRFFPFLTDRYCGSPFLSSLFLQSLYHASSLKSSQNCYFPWSGGVNLPPKTYPFLDFSSTTQPDMNHLENVINTYHYTETKDMQLLPRDQAFATAPKLPNLRQIFSLPQLIAGYRDSAAFLRRSADDLECFLQRTI